MDPKGGNPFLMDDYPTEADTTAAQASNPFLQDFGDAAVPIASGTEANPFFNFVADQPYQPTSDSTNPFASFGATPPGPEPETDIFANTQPPPVSSSVPTSNLFGVEAEVDAPKIIEATPTTSSLQPSPVMTTSSKPARPSPPPRPGPPPPPRNTKDLILSVTGAMDETSNQMLDRLQATRTPSPTLMHSPSPTPEHSLVDFIDVDSNVPELTNESVIKSDHQLGDVSSTGDILDLFSAPGTQEPVDVTKSFNTETIMSTATDTTSVTGMPVMATTLSDNPFADVDQQEVIRPFEAKRHSVTAHSPITDQHLPVTETAAIHENVGGLQQSETQAPSELFDSASAAALAMKSTSYYPTPQSTIDSTIPAAEASATAFADLIGDFGPKQTTAPVDLTTASHSASTNEYLADNYRADESADSMGRAVKTAKETDDAFDAFASKFDKAAEMDLSKSPFYDPFSNGTSTGQTAMDTSSDVWGDSTAIADSEPVTGFEETDGFDPFLSMVAPPSDVSTRRRGSGDSDAGPDFSVTIKPKIGENMSYGEGGPVPALAPPPRSPLAAAYADGSPRFNPFDKSGGFAQEATLPTEAALPSEMTRTDSQETPPTPLFDEDVSQPLENFPRTTYVGDGWEMQLRQPVKKKITGQRFWKKIFLKVVNSADSLPVLQLFNNKGEKDPYQELPLLPCYSVSEIAAQQFDQYGKIFTVKVQYIFYKERPGLRPGQVTKAERITNKLSQFAAYAIQGDLQGVKEFGSDVKKLGMPVEHAPQISQLLKLGSQNYEDMKAFSVLFEEVLFRLQIHRDRALQYKAEEVQISVVDELYVEQNAEGHIDKQIARVRLFFLGFLSGMPDVELGINDIWRQGKEIVSRHDIIPVATEEWIRLENVEFHSCIQQDEYEKSRIIKFKPPDACYIELMRFRVRPPRNRELPLQLKAVMCVTGNKVELRADILVPGFASRKLGRVPCEDVMVRFPIPECWIYLFRVEKHFRYGSVKSAHRRTGKIKGIERFLGAVDTLEPQLMEVTSGQAKYEHQHHAIVWRMPRLPKEGQGAYTTHQLVCRMNLTSYDQIPEKLSEYAYVEFTMPITQVSHTMARSVSFQNYDSDMPPEKYVKNLSRHEYRVGIEHTQGEGPGAYISATSMSTPKKTIPESSGESHDEGTDHPASDSDSSD